MKGKWPWLAAVAPAALTAAAALLLSVGALPNPNLSVGLAGDAAGLLLTAGLLISAAWLLVLWAGRHQEARSRRTVAAALGRAARARRQFLQRLDHELKHPVQVILNGIAAVEMDLPPEDQKRGLALVSGQARHLKSLVEGLRKLADLETGPLEIEEVDLAEVLRDAVDVARDGFHGTPAVAGSHSLVLNVRDTPRPLPTVPGDRDLLLQAFYSLLDNACKFSPPGTPVEVMAAQEGDSVRVEVLDRGQGIPAEDLPHLGEYLYRGKTGRNVPGSGLGLALVRTVVERHGGRLAVDSQVDRGTLVTIHLPVSGSPGASRPAQ